MPRGPFLGCQRAVFTTVKVLTILWGVKYQSNKNYIISCQSDICFLFYFFIVKPCLHDQSFPSKTLSMFLMENFDKELPCLQDQSF